MKQSKQTKKETQDLLDNLRQFYDQEFSPLLPSNFVKPNLLHMGNALQYESTDMLTNIKNNITSHFLDYCKEWINKVFKLKEEHKRIDNLEIPEEQKKLTKRNYSIQMRLVKEDILSRFGELGIFVKNGCLDFNPCLLRKDEFLKEVKTFNYVTTDFQHKSIELNDKSLTFTYCQIPVIYKFTNQKAILVHYNDEKSTKVESLQLNKEISQQVFDRTGKINHIEVHVLKSDLK